MAGDRQIVPANTQWADVVGYSRAVRVGSLVYVSGTTAAVAGGGVVGGDDVGAQATESLRRIEAALAEVGATLADVVRTRIYVTDIDRWEEVARAHGAVFGAGRPATSFVAVAALLDPALGVEIEADAVIGSGVPPGP